MSQPIQTMPNTMESPQANPIGLLGIAFIGLTALDPAPVDQTLKALGFSLSLRHRTAELFHYRQNDIHFLLSHATSGFERAFAEQHGSSVFAMGWWVRNAQQAFDIAVQRGATPFNPGKTGSCALNFPAVYGVGDSLIYFVEAPEQSKNRSENRSGNFLTQQDFIPLEPPELVEGKGFLRIDHLTNNVYKNTMAYWADFYKRIFGFSEIRYFDIRGIKTGLTSFALQSPCKTFSIPINEGNESKSQIEEYLREYRGAGVQHIALLTPDLITSVEKLQGTSIHTLDIAPTYYDTVFQRVPQVTEDRSKIRDLKILVDGDEEGYLLQIFTRNLFGPVFIEMIQRKNHSAFGEGNFTALFESIERDQERRGVL